MTTNTTAALLAALEAAHDAITSMKVEAETAAQGDEQMMLEACETISNEGLAASETIRAILSTAAAQPPAGWVMVPVEPTHAQAKAAADAWLDCGSRLFLNKALAALRAGIAAGGPEQWLISTSPPP